MADQVSCAFCDSNAEEKWPDALDKPDNQPTCYRHCGQATDGQHEADPNTFDVLTKESEEGHIIADLNCKHCGQSGSILLTIEDLHEIVNWR